MRHRWFVTLLVIGALLTSLGLGVAAAADPCACPEQTCGEADCAAAGATCNGSQCQRGHSLPPAEQWSWSGERLVWSGSTAAGDPPSWRISPALRPPQA